MNGVFRRVWLLVLCGILSAPPAACPQPPLTETPTEDPELLVKALSHPESRIRQNAANQLVLLGDKGIPRLLDVLKTPVETTEDEARTASAAIVLIRLKAAGTGFSNSPEPSLYQILSDPATRPARWNIVANLLAQIADDSLKDHADLWTWGVNHPSPLIGHASVLALKKIGDDAEAVRDALSEIERKTAPPALPDGERKAAEAALLKLLHRPRLPLTSIVLRPRIITDGRAGWEQAVPAYDPLLILETLIAIQADPQVMVEPLTVLSRHPSEYVRVDAAFYLATLEAEALPTDAKPFAVRVLAQLAKLPWGQVRELAVRRLGQIGQPPKDVIEALAGLLEDKDGEVRKQAAISLGNIGSAAKFVMPALDKAIEYSRLDTEDTFKAMREAKQKIENPEKSPQDENGGPMI